MRYLIAYKKITILLNLYYVNNMFLLKGFHEIVFQ